MLLLKLVGRQLSIVTIRNKLRCKLYPPPPVRVGGRDRTFFSRAPSCTLGLRGRRWDIETQMVGVP
jgi:hypothetical protein